MRAHIDYEGVAEFFTLGFTLNGKTMIKGVPCPRFHFPYVEPDGKATVKDFVEALDSAVEKCIKPNVAIALSGGIDSRIIAGLVARHDRNVCTYTFGDSSLEKTIAGKVSAVLGLKHYEITDNMFLTESSLEPLQIFLKKIGGVMDILNAQYEIGLTHSLKKIGIKSIMGGWLFEVVNGSWSLRNIASTKAFCQTMISNSNVYVPCEYKAITLKNLTKACEGYSFREALIHVLAFNSRPDLSHAGVLRQIHPLADRDVLRCLLSLPYELTVAKHLQREILRKHFPQLNRIPYATSLLPPSLPLTLHLAIRKAVRLLYNHLGLQSPNPLLTNDTPFYLRNNITFIHRILFENDLPPMFTRNIVSKLYENLSDANCLLLLRGATYNMIKDVV
jgi:hypothetical protein